MLTREEFDLTLAQKNSFFSPQAYEGLAETLHFAIDDKHHSTSIEECNRLISSFPSETLENLKTIIDLLVESKSDISTKEYDRGFEEGRDAGYDEGEEAAKDYIRSCL